LAALAIFTAAGFYQPEVIYQVYLTQRNRGALGDHFPDLLGDLPIFISKSLSSSAITTTSSVPFSSLNTPNATQRPGGCLQLH
jgi:hypothetical protein